MPTPRECVCCKEIVEIMHMISSSEVPPVTCITQHPGFPSVCLDIWVLTTNIDNNMEG